MSQWRPLCDLSRAGDGEPEVVKGCERVCSILLMHFMHFRHPLVFALISALAFRYSMFEVLALQRSCVKLAMSKSLGSITKVVKMILPGSNRQREFLIKCFPLDFDTAGYGMGLGRSFLSVICLKSSRLGPEPRETVAWERPAEL